LAGFKHLPRPYPGGQAFDLLGVRKRQVSNTGFGIKIAETDPSLIQTLLQTYNYAVLAAPRVSHRTQSVPSRYKEVRIASGKTANFPNIRRLAWTFALGCLRALSPLW
jgi:hypothetical protein